MTMGWLPRLSPVDTVDEAELNRGLRSLIRDGVCSQCMGMLTGGAFLVAYALALGASNTIIGLLAALGPLTQILQIPAITLIQRWQQRKRLVVICCVFSRLAWFMTALLPWTLPREWRATGLLAWLFVYFAAGAVAGCAFNSWMRDLIPEKSMGEYFGRRASIATSVGVVVFLIAGVAVEMAPRLGLTGTGIYSILFALGGVFGLAGTYFLSQIPEPRMAPPPRESVVSMLISTLRESGLRQLLIFLGAWNAAINLAAPFFVVYMLKRLGISMAAVVALSILSQLFNVMFLTIWGRVADRFSNKAVLGISGSLFILSIAMWPYTTMPERHLFTIPLLVVIHVLAGISTAGVTLCSGNIALKLAPRDRATAFLATTSLINSAAASVAPLIGGALADTLASRELRIGLIWSAVEETLPPIEVTALNLRGLDFAFAAAVLVGLYALHRLLTVREGEQVADRTILEQVHLETRKSVRHLSNVAGLRHLTYFPYVLLLHQRRTRRRAARIGGRTNQKPGARTT